jgi:Spy/CpxP family protein refolding chaperone
MTKVKIIVVVGFLVAFAAGLVLGFESRERTAQPAARQEHRGGWLTAELKLTPEQQEKMKTIWSEMPGRGGREREDRFRQLRQQRDEAIKALIRPEDKPRYDQILKDFTDKTNALNRELHDSFQAAIDATKPILNPEQRAKYEQLLQHHQWDRGSRDRHRGERERDAGRSGGRRTTSRPAPQR